MRQILIAIAFLTLAAATRADDVSFPAGTVSNTRIGPRDVLEIKVVQDDKLNTRATVSEEGMITIPMLGKVAVAGLTAHEIELRLKAALEARLLKVADVSVDIVQYTSRPISVVGAVTRPGMIGTGGSLTLIQALTQAGGLAPGYGKTLYILRTAPNGLTEQLPVDIDDLLVNGNPDLNIPLAPNDLVNVPLEQPLVIYLFGEVMHPGKLEIRRTQNPSLLQAIAAAGGPTDRAGSKATIRRAGNPNVITVNWKRISEGDAPDVPLQDGDTIYLKESFF
jgi:polysaccharide export outer membrane protein